MDLALEYGGRVRMESENLRWCRVHNNGSGAWVPEGSFYKRHDKRRDNQPNLRRVCSRCERARANRNRAERKRLSVHDANGISPAINKFLYGRK